MAYERPVALTAAEAAARSRKRNPGGGDNSADAVNFNLTLERVSATIAAASALGEKRVCYPVPWFVLDGTCTDAVRLARQLRRRLQGSGYVVSRSENMLYIDWDMDLWAQEAQAASRARRAPEPTTEVERENKRTEARRKRAARLNPPLAGQRNAAQTTPGFTVSRGKNNKRA